MARLSETLHELIETMPKRQSNALHRQVLGDIQKELVVIEKHATALSGDSSDCHEACEFGISISAHPCECSSQQVDHSTYQAIDFFTNLGKQS